ncbi:MAG: alcohol dehydrogenase catalytic domain-containing protein [Nitrososphaeraceae archaeon]
MKAAVLYSPNNLCIEEINNSKNITEKFIMLKVNVSAICGYDVAVFRYGHKKVTLPIILGHEFCAQTLETITLSKNDANDSIYKYKEITSGTRVVVSPVIPCFICRYCHNKMYNLCVNLKEIGSSINGGFAEYIKIPKKIIQIGGIVPVPDNLSDEEAALLEPLACCLNGFSKINYSMKEISCAVIIGDGPIGLLHLQLSKNVYCIKKTFVIGRIPLRLKKALDMGADKALLLDDYDNIDELKSHIFDLTDGIGANLVIIATSNPDSLRIAYKISSKNSIINLFTDIVKESTTEKLDLRWLHYNQISLIGSFSSTPNMLFEASRLASNKKVDLSKIISHRFSLDNIKDALTVAENYYGLRAIINKF